MKLTLLDGHKSVGGAKFLVESGDSSLFLDFGLNFGPFGKLFGEFLQPRSCRGLHDLWQTDLIPPLAGCYRPDLFPADFAPDAMRALRPTAVVLSHAHLDHIGLIGVLDESIPIACTATTAMILKSLQDSGSSSCYQEYAYAVPKIANGMDATLKSAGFKVDAIGRPLCTLDALRPDAASYWTTSPNPNGRQIAGGKIQGTVKSFGDFQVNHFPVDHSIPGCSALEISDAEQRIVYTGDLRLHGRNGANTQKLIESMASNPPDVLLVEGTRIGRKPGRNVTETEVAENAWLIVRVSVGRLVVADFGGRHIERLSSFLEIAESTRRCLVISPRDAHLIRAISFADSHYDLLDHPYLRIFADPKSSQQSWEQSIRSDFSSKLISPIEIALQSGSFILAMSLWDLPDLLDLGVKDAVYIYSSSEAYGEDSRLSLFQLGNWVNELGMELHGFQWNGGETGFPEFTPGLNSSGHIDEEGLEAMLHEIQAPVVVPVHTEHPDWFHSKLAGSKSKVV